MLFRSIFRKEEKRDIYEPTNISFINGNPIFCDTKELEMGYFLFYHPYRIGSDEYNHAENADKGCFTLVNPKKNAEEVVKKSETLHYALNFLYAELKGETERKRDIAMAMGHAKVSDMGVDEVTALLAVEINKNPDNFIYYTEGKHTQVKARVREAIDAQVIVCDTSSKTWYWVIQSTGMKGDVICQTPPNKSSEEAIYEYFSEKHSAFEKLIAAGEVVSKMEMAEVSSQPFTPVVRNKGGRPRKIEIA